MSHHPSGVHSDGANEEYRLEDIEAIPRYDDTIDAATVPAYTRKHLKRFSTDVKMRLAEIEDEMEEVIQSIPEAQTRLLRCQSRLTVLIVATTILWFITCIILLVAMYSYWNSWRAKQESPEQGP
ncbi:hypothetical protein GGR50DRAFT_695860 [Xylaria sp. CBS 124048]|nr:hypothetical protein GGR50DRAFT_695860 [Xylaria sp. CBS 124048]